MGLSSIQSPKHWIPDFITAVPFALCLGCGISVLIRLFWANRKRLKAVLRPNAGRFISAVLMGLLTPYAVVNGVPIFWFPLNSVFRHEALIFLAHTTAPWIVAGQIYVIFGNYAGLGVQAAEGIKGLALLTVPYALGWYPICAIIISGVRSKLMRVAIFNLMFWAAVSGLVLWGGVSRLSL